MACQWSPARTLEQTDAILCAPGRLHEVETQIINGQSQRVYTHLWASLRNFWLETVHKHSNKTYIVFEDQRFSYGEVFERAMKVAAVFRNIYDIRKGDRVGICSRNCPDYLVSFWACHLIGAVSVLPNAWLPLETLQYCLLHTGCKLVIVDPERADRLESSIPDIQRGTAEIGFLVLDVHEGKGRWRGIRSFQEVLEHSTGPTDGILTMDPHIQPEDNATIIFTSGTTGLPKGVLGTQRQFLTNILNILTGGLRAALRRGEEYPQPMDEVPQQGVLVSVPLFHVTGITSFSMMATMLGLKIVLTRKWVPEDAARLIKRENVSVAGGVPAMVSDLIDSSIAGYKLQNLLFGGSPAPDSLVSRARKSFPSAIMSQAYGLTETNSIAVSFAGEDYAARPMSTGRPSPVNDVKIMHDNTCVPPRTTGEVWLRGPNVMKGYWHDPEATAKVLTEDGWLKTGDVGYLDEEGFLYIKDRIKDIIIRGGENIDSTSVENALYRDHRVSEAAAVGVPDERLGEIVAAVVSIKPAFQDSVTEAGLIGLARQSLPRFAVPEMIVILHEPFKLTPSGKIVKGDLRKLAQHHWEARRRNGTARQPSANL